MSKDRLSGISAEFKRALSDIIKNEIGSHIRIRRLPQIKFILDTSIEYSSRISEMLKEVSDDGSKSD